MINGNDYVDGEDIKHFISVVKSGKNAVDCKKNVKNNGTSGFIECHCTYNII